MRRLAEDDLVHLLCSYPSAIESSRNRYGTKVVRGDVANARLNDPTCVWAAEAIMMSIVIWCLPMDVDTAPHPDVAARCRLDLRKLRSTKRRARVNDAAGLRRCALAPSAGPASRSRCPTITFYRASIFFLDLPKVRSTQANSDFIVSQISATSPTDRGLVDPVSCRLGMRNDSVRTTIRCRAATSSTTSFSREFPEAMRQRDYH